MPSNILFLLVDSLRGDKCHGERKTAITPNIDKLIQKIKSELSKKMITNHDVLITRERHRVKLNLCLKEIDNFLKKDQNKEIEMAAEDLRLATRHLGGIVGKVDVEEILGSIFKDFCIGK